MSKGDVPVWFGLSRNVIVLGLVSLLTDMASEMIVPLMPLFLSREFLAGPATLGIITGVAESLSSFLRLFSGWLSDRARRRKLLIVLGYGVASLARPFMGLATAWWHVLLVRVIDRTGKGVRIAPRDALLADSCDEPVRGRAFGFQQMADNLGAATGPLIALALLSWVTGEVRTVFLLSAVPGALVLFAAAAGIVEKPPKRTSEPVRLTLAPFDARFRIYLVATLLFHLGVASELFLILRMDAAAFPLPRILVTWFGFCALRSLSAMLGGTLSDLLGRRAMILIGWILFAMAWGALAWAPPAGVLAAVAAYGLFGGFSQGPQRALVADLVPEHLRGTAYGAYACTLGVAQLVASVGFGAVWKFAGMEAAFLTGAGFALLGLAALAPVRPPLPAPRQPRRASV